MGALCDIEDCMLRKLPHEICALHPQYAESSLTELKGRIEDAQKILPQKLKLA